MAATLAVEAVGLSENKFQKSFERIEKILLDTRKYIQDQGRAIAKELAPMSYNQIKAVKHRLRGLLGPSQIDRFTLYGRGKMPWHLAVPGKGISPTKYMILPDSARSILHDGDALVEILTPRGVRRKAVRELGKDEFDQITDRALGILSAAQQAKKLARLAGPERKGDVWEVSKIEVDSGKRGYVVLEIESVDGARMSARVRLANLRKFLS